MQNNQRQNQLEVLKTHMYTLFTNKTVISITYCKMYCTHTQLRANSH